MSLTYGFYNSVNNDRVYDAEQVSSIFDGLVNDGIYMSVGGKMMVKINTGLTLKISTGRAWFKHTWTYNDADYNIELDPADPLLNRIDAIILEVDRSIGVRANSFKIVKGTAATNPSRPTLENTETKGQYALAYISIAAGQSEISQADITNVIGTSETPYVKGIIENISIDDMMAQWQTQFNQWMAAIEAANTEWTNEQHQAFEDWVDAQETAFEEWSTEYQEEMNAFKTAQQSAFTTWFDSMKDQLSEDAAGHLQLEIDDINSSIQNIITDINDINSDITDINNDIIDISDNINNINTALSGKVDKTGGTISGNLTIENGALIGTAQLSGIPTAPTAQSGTNTDQIATTSFVQTSISGKQNQVGYGTTELTPGTSNLTTGNMYVVYE